MTNKVLAEILVEHGGGRKEGDSIQLPSDSEATLFASLGAEPLIIGKVLRIELGTELVVAVTRKERYALAYEDLRALRFSRSDSGAGYDP